MDRITSISDVCALLLGLGRRYTQTKFPLIVKSTVQRLTTTARESDSAQFHTFLSALQISFNVSLFNAYYDNSEDSDVRKSYFPTSEVLTNTLSMADNATLELLITSGKPLQFSKSECTTLFIWIRRAIYEGVHNEL